MRMLLSFVWPLCDVCVSCLLEWIPSAETAGRCEILQLELTIEQNNVKVDGNPPVTCQLAVVGGGGVRSPGSGALERI